MAKTQSWEVSDELWQHVQPFVPKAPARPARQRYQRRPGGGRKPLGDRQIFAGIVYVLRTGCQWKALPKSFGSASAVHKHFQRWRGQGFFLALWQAGLAEYDEMEGIAWEWQSIDGTQGKAPLAQEAVGNHPPIGKKKAASAACWWTVLASRCPLSSAEPTGMRSNCWRSLWTALWSCAPKPAADGGKTCARTRAIHDMNGQLKAKRRTPAVSRHEARRWFAQMTQHRPKQLFGHRRRPCAVRLGESVAARRRGSTNRY
jgi:transposase